MFKVNTAYIEAVTAGRQFSKLDRFRLLDSKERIVVQRSLGAGPLLTSALSGIPLNHPKHGVCLLEI